MEPIRKISHVKNNTLVLYGLDALNDKAVEVVINPLTPEEVKGRPDAVDHFCGIFKNGSSLTESLLEERKKDLELEEKNLTR